MYRLKIYDKKERKVIFNSKYDNLNDLNIHLKRLINDMIFLMDKKELEYKIYHLKEIEFRFKKINDNKTKKINYTI